MNVLLTARNGALGLLLGGLVLGIGWLLGLPSAAADDGSVTGLRPIADPTLLPIDANETYAPTTLRLLGDAPAAETRAGQSQLRVLPGGSPRAETTIAPTTITQNHFPAKDAAPTDARLPSDAPPNGPWAFVEDSPTPQGIPAGEEQVTATSDVVQTTYQDGSKGPYDVQKLLATLDEEPMELAQAGPTIPRVLPPPQAMLPPDPAYEDLRGPASAGRLRDETQDVPPRLPPRRLPVETGPGARWPQSAPTGPCPPLAMPPYDPRYNAQPHPDVQPQYNGPRGIPNAEQYDPEYYLEHATQAYRATGRTAGTCPGETCRETIGKPAPRRLLVTQPLAARDVTLGGWVDQGITGLGNNPTDRYNGPVTFNDRYSDYQMNQLYLFLERPVATGGDGLDFGGRLDVLYGTDARFVKSVDGLEASWNETERFYQIALPQFYFDVGFNDLTVRLGHFYSIMGYEQVPAPSNFFYSHSYAFQYGEPFTHTGMLASYDLDKCLSLSGGFSRGINQFDDTDGRNQLGVLAAIDWASCDGRRAVQFGINSGEQGPGNITTIYSLVGQLRLTDRLSWILEHNYGQSTGGNPRDVRKAQWYGLSQYVLYQWTESFGLGTRIEWFSDVNGTRVRGLGDGNQATGPYVGNFYEVTLGTNWQPGPNVMLRPEIRWDWYEGESPVGHQPFDAGRSDRQLLYAFDVIVQF